MPRGQKNKHRNRSKRQQARDESQGVQSAPAPEEEEPEAPSFSSLIGAGDAPLGGIAQEPQGAAAPDSPEAGVSCTSSDVGAEGAEGSSDEKSSKVAALTTRKDPLTRKASMLAHFLLQKFTLKEPITQADMLKVIKKKYKEQFPEILKRTTERLELVFGLELKEVNPSNHIYALVSKLGLSTEGSLSGSSGLPKTGLVMTLLGVIFMKGNRATEEEIWDFLNVLGIQEGKRHLIFGEPRKLITQDLVQEKYLEYRQVADSDPPRYEFLWGPRARAETTKMKVLEVLAKINDTVPSSFPDLYEEALRDEVERAERRSAARAGSVASARIRFKAMSLKSPKSPHM